MRDQGITASLNLLAVLQNIENLVQLDPEMAALVRDWDLGIQFTVRGGPSAALDFKGGRCTHVCGRGPRANIHLFFLSPAHLNRMFDGKANPIPLRGITRIGFLTKDFTRLTNRLTHYLRPGEGPQDGDYVRINTALSLYTAAHAVRELVRLEPTSRKVAAGIPRGVMQIEVSNGPCATLTFEPDGGIRVGKSAAQDPLAKMVFKDMEIANAMLAGKRDAFLAVAAGDVQLSGMLPMIDSVSLILDRIPMYLV